MDKEEGRGEGSTCGKATKSVAGRKGGACDKTTKGAAKGEEARENREREAGTPYKGKSAEERKEIKESRRR